MRYLRITSFLLLLISTNKCFSQEKIKDSLNIKLKNAKNSNDSINAYLYTSFKVYIADPEKAIQLANTAFILSKRYDNSRGIGLSYSRKGYAFITRYKMENAISNFKLALYYNEKNKDYEVAKIYSGLATCYSYKHDYISALTYFIKCKNLLEKLKEYKIMISPLLNITQIYLEYYKLDEAYKYIKEAIVYAKKSKDKRALITSYYCLGKYNLLKSDYKNAIKNFNSSLEYNSNKDIMMFYCFSLWGKGVSYDSLKNNNEAFKYYNYSLDFSQKNNLNEATNNVLGSLCNWYVANKNYKQAIEIGSQYFKADIVKASQGVSLSMARAYEKIGNFKEAFKYNNIFIETNLLSSADLNIKLNSLVFTNEVKKREGNLVIEKLKVENESNKYKTKIRLIFIIVIAAFLIITLILINISNKQKLKINKAKLRQIEFNSQILAKENEIELKKKEMKIKNIEMEKLAIYITEKNTFLDEFKEMVDKLNKSKDINLREDVFKKLMSFTSEKFSLTEERHEFNLYINNIYSDFLLNLAIKYPQLNEYDKRLAALLKLNYNTKEVASILNISVKGVQAQRYKLRKRLDISEETDLNEFFSNF